MPAGEGAARAKCQRDGNGESADAAMRASSCAVMVARREGRPSQGCAVGPSQCAFGLLAVVAAVAWHAGRMSLQTERRPERG